MRPNDLLFDGISHPTGSNKFAVQHSSWTSEFGRNPSSDHWIEQSGNEDGVPVIFAPVQVVQGRALLIKYFLNLCLRRHILGKCTHHETGLAKKSTPSISQVAHDSRPLNNRPNVETDCRMMKMRIRDH